MIVRGGKYKILLIDSDGNKYHKSLAASLKGHKIIINSDQLKASEFFFHNDVDLVLLEHSANAPCQALLKFFKSIKPSIPVIIVTDCGSEELAVNVFRCGAWDYFKKPFVVDELSRRIETVLGLKHGKDKNEHQHLKGLYRAIGYINKYYSSKIELPQVASEAGMSISCFTRKFKERMGVTFTMYVNNLRISKATEMLKEDDLSMSDIAFVCGFSNQFHFTRTFKKITKAPPSVYRKSLKE